MYRWRSVRFDRRTQGQQSFRSEFAFISREFVGVTGAAMQCDGCMVYIHAGCIPAWFVITVIHREHIRQVTCFCLSKIHDIKHSIFTKTFVIFILFIMLG